MLDHRIGLVATIVISFAVLCATASAQVLEKKTLSLAAAKKIAAAAEAEAAKNNWNVIVTVLDDGGNTIVMERMDGAQLGSIEISHSKAMTALSFKQPTRNMQERLKSGGSELLSAPNILTMAGGLPINYEGKLIGAVGVSGATSDQDEQCAKAGVAAFTAQP